MNAPERGLFYKLVERARRRSAWLFHLNTGSCNGCDIELVTCLSPRYDVEQLGIRLEGSPRHADILCVSGPVTHNTRAALETIYAQIAGSEGGRRNRLLSGKLQRLRWQPGD